MAQSLPEIIVREATREDAEVAVAAFEAAFLPLRSVYRPVAGMADRQVDCSQEGTRLIASIEGQVVGTVEFDRHIECLHVVGLAVCPDFQRRGVARAMIDQIEAHAIVGSRKLVVLKTVKETGNVLVFKKLGFRVTHEEVTSCFVSEKFPGLHEVWMERVVGR